VKLGSGLTVPYVPKPDPNQHSNGQTHERLRRDRIDKAGKITLRHGGQLYSIGVGRTHTGTHVLVLSKTSTSASSTPPPANYSANSSSTPPGATSPPNGHPDRPEKTKPVNPQPWVHGFPMS
jgi:hypothetical protein